MAGAAKAITSAGIQVLHVIGARNEPVEIPPDLPAPYVTVKFIEEMELGLRRGRPDAVPGRRDDLRGDGGGRHAGDLRAAAVRQRRAAPQRAAASSRRGGGMIVDDGDLTPAWIEQNIIPLGARSGGAGEDELGGRVVRPPRRRRGAAVVRVRSRCRGAFALTCDPR